MKRNQSLISIVRNTVQIQLRDYQQDGISRIRESLKTHNAPLYVLPTGGGKTVIFCYIAEQAYNRGKSVVILVHRDNLLTQASRKLTEFGIPHGRIGGSRSRTKDLIQVASVQTLIRRLDDIQEPDLIIVDEGHHLTKNTMWGKVIERFKNSKIIGVTATPIRLDGKGLGVQSGGYYDDMIIGPTISDLITEGYLSNPVTYHPSKAIDLKGIKKIAGDYKKSDLETVIAQSAIVGDAIAHYRKLADGQPAIAFCISVDHAKSVADKFQAAGYNFVSIDGGMPRSEIEKTIENLALGKIHGITSCDLISEGTDVPVVSCGIFLRPTMSTALDLQQKGRILRPYHGKKNAILLDHVGNCFRHGLPEIDRDWNLSGEIKKPKKQTDEPEFKTIQCEKCYFVWDRKTGLSCPSCGEESAKKREILEIEGELVQQSQEIIIKKQQKREIFEAKTLDDFIKIAKKRGYKTGWAQHMFAWKIGKIRK